MCLISTGPCACDAKQRRRVRRDSPFGENVSGESGISSGKGQPSISAGNRLIDSSVRDIARNANDPRLDSRTVTNFSWLDDGRIVKVYMPLDRQCILPEKEDIVTAFAARSFHVRATAASRIDGLKREFALGIPHLSFPVVAEKCRAKARQVSGEPSIVIILPKEDALKKWASLGAGGTGALPRSVVGRDDHQLLFS